MARIDVPRGREPELRDELLAALPALAPIADVEADLSSATFREILTIGDGFLELPAEHELAARAVLARRDNEATLRDRADAAIANLQAAWDGWAGLTAAQKDAALKLNVRATIALIRLQLRKLDST